MRRLLVGAFVVMFLLSGCILPGELTYPSPQTLRIGVPVKLEPSVKGVVATFKVTPALPKGLTLNASTGVISGTPTQETPKANYVIRASNSLGSATFTLVLTVLPVAPSNLQYQSPQTLTVGDAVDLQPTVTGTVASYTVLPTLPAGLTLNSTTGVISGTPTAESASATYTITAANAGGSTTFALSISVAAATQVLPRDLKFYTEVDNPQIFSFKSDTDDTVTFLGRKDATGAPVGISDILMRSPAGEQSGLTADAQGRPVLARLPNGARIAFEWLTPTHVRATVTTANGVANASIEFDLPALAGAAAPTASRVSTQAAGAVQAADDGGNSAANVRVNVTSFGQPVSGAEVFVSVIARSDLSKTAQYVATEEFLGTYTTPFVNFPNSIPAEAVFEACSAAYDKASVACDYGIALSSYMMTEGCFLLGGGLSGLIGPEGFLIVVPCEALFATGKFSCQVIKGVGSRPFCGAISGLVELFAPDGVSMQVRVRKDGVTQTATKEIDGNQPLAQFTIELPLPRFLHDQISDKGSTTLTVRENGTVVNRCSYSTEAPASLSLIFSGSTPHAVLTNSTFRHSRTGGNCTPVIEGSFNGASRDVGLTQSGNSLSGSAQFSSGGGSSTLSVNATREGGRVHGTIVEHVEVSFTQGLLDYKFETDTTLNFDAR
jgi:hypothetical protein